MERSWGCQRLVRTPTPPLRVGEFTETGGRFHRSARALSAVPAGCFPPKYALGVSGPCLTAGERAESPVHCSYGRTT
ncbi:hypothetical protein DS837_30735 [Azospirillum brasilense]|uniref:Uncharacterized protein n=1 Tax=Azospirillum brasilense TaxID=192 RepID=A0A6L3ARC3_AZOBR|nr:hypothetical protein DS837_30735 [Azospirillum brasilense]